MEGVAMDSTKLDYFTLAADRRTQWQMMNAGDVCVKYRKDKNR